MARQLGGRVATDRCGCPRAYDGVAGCRWSCRGWSYLRRSSSDCCLSGCSRRNRMSCSGSYCPKSWACAFGFRCWIPRIRWTAAFRRPNRVVPGRRDANSSCAIHCARSSLRSRDGCRHDPSRSRCDCLHDLWARHRGDFRHDRPPPCCRGSSFRGSNCPGSNCPCRGSRHHCAGDRPGDDESDCGCSAAPTRWKSCYDVDRCHRHCGIGYWRRLPACRIVCRAARRRSRTELPSRES